MYTFRVKFKNDESYYLATKKAEDSFPMFDNNGLLQEDFQIQIRCTKENTSNNEVKQFTINRDMIPEEIWYTTYVNSYPIDFYL